MIRCYRSSSASKFEINQGYMGLCFKKINGLWKVGYWLLIWRLKTTDWKPKYFIFNLCFSVPWDHIYSLVNRCNFCLLKIVVRNIEFQSCCQIWILNQTSWTLKYSHFVVHRHGVSECDGFDVKLEEVRGLPL